MRVRSALGILVGAGYLAFVAHAASQAQCPVRETGACARVHALMMRARPLAPAAIAALPTHGAADADAAAPLRLAAVPVRG